MFICLDQRTGTGCGTENRSTAQHCSQCGKPLRFALELRDPGSLVGGYRIVRVIGHGGFGAVYEAVDASHNGALVAIKETFDPDSIRVFHNEFAVLSQLNHVHLPRYDAMFEADGNGYLVMEFVPGQSLQEILDRQRGPLVEAQVLGYALQLCDVLSYLHNQRPAILHRDIKPANIRLTPEGLIKLVDFGLIKQAGQQTRATIRGMGTLAYAPIEQYGRASAQTDARSDLYSFGATLYHLLTNQEPNPATERIASALDPLPPPRQINPTLSMHVTHAISTALGLTQESRHANADALKWALLGMGMGRTPDVPATPTPSSRGSVPQQRSSIQAPTPHVPRRVALPPWVPTLLKVPAGPFLMGIHDTDKLVYSDEKPQHRLELPDFWIGKTPITNAQFRPFVEGDGYTNAAYWTRVGWQWREQDKISRPDYWNVSTWNSAEQPVVGVNWFEALAYCRWLSMQTSRLFRLPSEAEWEKAARGPEGLIWPWGNSWQAGRCNSKEAGIKQTTPVTQFPGGASPYGALDMAGNVWEWCATQFGKGYPYQLEDEWAEAYLQADEVRRLRGGWYGSAQERVRGACRDYDGPRTRYDVGLRVASHATSQRVAIRMTTTEADVGTW